jgi:hypothetical protein
MTKSTTRVVQGTDGSVKYHIFDLDITTYTVDGEPLPTNELGLGTVFLVEAVSTEKGYKFRYDYTNSKMLVRMHNYDATDGGDIALTTSADAGTCRVFVRGIG